MKIVSWNVAGIRANLKKNCLQNFLENGDFDIVCIQETKATKEQVTIPESINNMYPYRYWESTQGITQRKGLSGTCIWCKSEPLNYISAPQFDLEGRITTVEFENIFLMTVYTPNSQSADSPRYEYRINNWDGEFREYIKKLNQIKPVIVCGDFNVSHLDIDIYNSKKNKNKVAGFFDSERNEFSKHLECGFVDAFRYLYPDTIGQYTYWNQIRKTCRENNIGWRLDYFLVSKNIENQIDDCNILTNVMGSDHCPIVLSMK